MKPIPPRGKALLRAIRTSDPDYTITAEDDLKLAHRIIVDMTHHVMRLEQMNKALRDRCRRRGIAVLALGTLSVALAVGRWL